MIQKYLILRDESSGNLTIEERAVIDPIPRGSNISQLTDDSFTLINFITYSQEKIGSAIKEGNASLISAIRTPCFFPIKEHCDAITEMVIRICKSGETFAELFFDTCNMEDQNQ